MLSFFKRKKQLDSSIIKDFSDVMALATTSASDLFAKESENKHCRAKKIEVIAVFIAPVFEKYIKSGQKEKSQQLYDYMFDVFDASMRETGVSDIRVGPEIRRLASILDVRIKEYTGNLDNLKLEELLKANLAFLSQDDLDRVLKAEVN